MHSYHQNDNAIPFGTSDEFGDVTVGFNKYFDGSKRHQQNYNGISISDVFEYIDDEVYNEGDFTEDDEMEKFIESNDWLSSLRAFCVTNGIGDMGSTYNFRISQ